MELKSIIAMVREQNPYNDTVSRDMSFYDDGQHEILRRQNRTIPIYEDKNVDGIKKRVQVGNKVITTAKMPYRFEKKIVETATAFLFGNPMGITCDEDNTEKLQKIKNAWNSAKMDYFNKTLCRRVKIEGRAAEWIFKPEGDDKIRILLLSKYTGYDVYPYFDGYGDLKYVLLEYTATNADTGEDETTVKLFSAEEEVTIIAGDTANAVIKPNKLKKIPIIIYDQNRCDWEDVKPELNAYDRRSSKHSDTNDYVGSPSIKAKGKVTSLPDKESDVKVFQVGATETPSGGIEYGDVDYMTYDSLPQSIAMEIDRNKSAIFDITSTPDLSFNNVKGIGNISEKTLKLLFLDATIKAKNSEEIFGSGITRRINVMCALMGIEPFPVRLEFSSILPNFLDELINTLTTATAGNPVMSQRTAVKQNPMVRDLDEEMKLIDEENGIQAGTLN